MPSTRTKLIDKIYETKLSSNDRLVMIEYLNDMMDLDTQLLKMANIVNFDIWKKNINHDDFRQFVISTLKLDITSELLDNRD